MVWKAGESSMFMRERSKEKNELEIFMSVCNLTLLMSFEWSNQFVI